MNATDPRPSLTGNLVGVYQIQSLLGRGGMGEVYRARDTRLGRDVAIKVLPRAFTSDHERLARFEREARVLAALNHPNVAAIYGVEDAGGVPALVLELVDGETLADRIARGPLAPDEVVPIARQIAEALDAAHEKGIVHRDLKPSNIKVTPDGVVKVLDFGLAKAAAGDGTTVDQTQSPTLTVEGTLAGVILGTAAYMSPEQARGQTVDKRTDIWAFGVVIYEMLSGRRPFEGETLSDTVAAVLRGEPDWARLPRDTPAYLRSLLKRMLMKDPKLRLRDVADAFVRDVEVVATDQSSSNKRQRGAVIAVTAVILVLSIAVAALGWRYTRASVDRDWVGELLGGPSVARGARLSPDGTTLAFQAWVNGLNQVAVMNPETGDWKPLTDDRSSGPILDLSWSPDGSRIYFDRYLDVPRGVFTVPAIGGNPRPVVSDAMYPKALPDGSLLVVRLNDERRLQLHRFWPDSSRIERLPAFWTPTTGQPLVAVFGDAKEAVFYGLPAGADVRGDYSLNVLELATGRTRSLGSPIRIVQGGFPGALATSRDGSRVVVSTPAGDLYRIVSIPRDGSAGADALLTLLNPPGYLDIGRDDAVYADQGGGLGEILRFPASGGTPQRTPLGGAGGAPLALPSFVGLPDGRVLVPSRGAGRNRLLLAGTDRAETPLLETATDSATPTVVLGDDAIAFVAETGPNQVIAVASLTNGQILRRLNGTRGVNAIQSLSVSTDRKTVFYASGGTIWSVPSDDGPPREVHQGDAVAVDPRTNELIVQQIDPKGARLVRVNPATGQERPVAFQGDVFLAPFPLSGTAVAPDGRILVQIIARDSWFFKPGVVDPRTGRLERIPLNYDGDALSPAWSPSGDVIAAGGPLVSSLLRFRLDSR